MDGIELIHIVSDDGMTGLMVGCELFILFGDTVALLLHADQNLGDGILNILRGDGLAHPLDRQQRSLIHQIGQICTGKAGGGAGHSGQIHIRRQRLVACVDLQDLFTAQHAQGYVPIKVRNAIIPVCNIGSAAGIPLALIGIFLNISGLVYFGLILYAFVALFQFVTLPVELDASHRALKVIDETKMLEGNEYNGARKVLTAAAMTYVVAVATALANLLRFVIIFLGNNRRSS